MEGLHHDTILDEDKPMSKPNEPTTPNEPVSQDGKGQVDSEGFADFLRELVNWVGSGVSSA